MSKETISSAEFPLKPHNSQCDAASCALHTQLTLAGPAVKVPGLVFCSGQVGMGEIKAATVSRLPRFGAPLGWI
jgi:2-iminobutanoate/2-iminopropanoate deaminase